MILAQETLDVFRAWLLLSRGRVDFCDRDPLAHNAFVVAIDVVVRGFHVRPVRQGFNLFDVLHDGLDLCLGKGRYD